ncbi:cytochrome P450, family 94, subfamily C, polypeptide 1 [Actinidia rufa]|uniref:Cytochrome P450, family 94, subfamily C, polypeptide 1 n=1 Tax=Actinidia rufa TaxID=165716 RepID=A0A7J0FGV2_9ERIC|nr:cytochrome P450, family 94, subfamily C, polypeptide 1 [Actinidia rufa]
MLKTRFENYPKGKQFSAILGDLLGRGIFNVDGEPWMFQRKMASLELGKISIRSYAFEVVNSEIKTRLVPLMLSLSDGKGDNNLLDLQDVFRRFSFDSICRFSFGLDPKCLELSLPMSEFAVSFDRASNISAERAMTSSPWIWKVKRILKLGSERQLKRRHHDDQCPGPRAGRDTVASALTSLFWLLSRHPEVELAILAEVDRVVGANQELTSFEQMQELHYLEATVYENMRLYPPIQFDSKFCLDDDFLSDGTFVKRGTRVTYHPYAMGRMEEIWGPDCLKFKPERWLRDGVFFQENPFKYPVFQAGLRVCLGKEMALVKLKTVALSLLRRFHIKLAVPDDQGLQFSPGLTATLRGGLPVLIQERKDQKPIVLVHTDNTQL